MSQFTHAINVLVWKARQADGEVDDYLSEAMKLEDRMQTARDMAVQRETDAQNFRAAARELGWDGDESAWNRQYEPEMKEVEVPF